MKFSDLDDRFRQGEILFNGEFVTQVELDGSTWYFTSCSYLEKTADGILIWYNKDASIVMKAKYFDIDKEPTPLNLLGSDYLYFKDGEWLTAEDLLIQYLIANVKPTDSPSEQIIDTMDGVNFVQNNYGLDVVSKLYDDLLKRKDLNF